MGAFSCHNKINGVLENLIRIANLFGFRNCKRFLEGAYLGRDPVCPFGFLVHGTVGPYATEFTGFSGVPVIILNRLVSWNSLPL